MSRFPLSRFLACDLVVTCERAALGTPEINVGAFPFMILAVIDRNVARTKTTELQLLGERIDAHDAHRLGIVDRVRAFLEQREPQWTGR